jgi:hypothetical protein
MKKKIKKIDLINHLRNKKCNTPYTFYIAEKILEDKNHPIIYIDPEEFKLRQIFNYIEVEYDKSKSKAHTSS